MGGIRLFPRDLQPPMPSQTLSWFTGSGPASGFGGFPKLGIPIWGSPFFGVSVLGSMLGSLNLWKLSSRFMFLLL